MKKGYNIFVAAPAWLVFVGIPSIAYNIFFLSRSALPAFRFLRLFVFFLLLLYFSLKQNDCFGELGIII